MAKTKTRKPATRTVVSRTPAIRRPQLPADQHPVAVYLGSLPSELSRRTMAIALSTAARMVTGTEQADAMAVEWWRLEYQHLARLRARLLERYEATTSKKVLAAVRRVLREAAALRLMTWEQYLAATGPSSLRIKLPEKPPAGRDLSDQELHAIFAAIAEKPSPIRERDAVLVALLVAGGLRRAEAVNLDVDDYDQVAGKVTVRGKGDVVREVFVRNEARLAVEGWLRVRGNVDGPLLLHVDRHGVIRTHRLSPTAVYKRVRLYVKATPHDMRRTFVGRALDAGTDLGVVQKLCGHRSPLTTSRYDRRDARAREQAARLVRLPLVVGR